MKLTAMVGLQSFDAVSFTSRKMTDEGFLEAPANIARSGVQIFRAGEFKSLMEAGMDANTVIRLHRPDDELFNPAVMTKAEGLPIIVEPHQRVTADNWKQLAVGDITGITRNGTFLSAGKALIKDKNAIALVQSGKKYQSLGYTFDLDPTPGTNAQGEAYDGIQRNVVPNHVVICDNPRGGTQCRIGDTQGEVKQMIIQIDGIPVEVGNDTAVAAVQKVINERNTLRDAPVTVTLKIGEASKTITGADAIAKEITDRDAKIVELKSKVQTPEAINKLVDDAVKVRVAIIGDAVSVVKDFKADGKDNLTIQREVITTLTTGDTGAPAKAVMDAILSGSKLEGADAAQVSTIFRALCAAAKGTKTAAAEPDAATGKILAGDTAVAGGAKKTLVGREAWLARQAAGYPTDKKGQPKAL
jgi:hypothetical protein